jgi:O-antigen/teichoic acid export membrane protein
MNRHTRVARNILALLLNQLGTWTITFVLTLVVPKYLGVQLFGLYSFVTTFVGFLALGMTLGTGTYLTWRIAREPEQAGRLTVNTLALQLPLGLLCAAVAFFVLPLFDQRPYVLPLMLLMLASTLLSSLGQTCTAALGGLQNMRTPALLWLASSALGMVLVLVCVHLHGSLLLLATFGLATQSTALLSILIYTHRRIRLFQRIEFDLWPKIVAGGLPFLAWSAVLLFYGQVDIPMLKLISGDVAVGWYAAASRISSIPGFLPTIVVTAILPALSHERTADSPHFRSLASRSLRLVAAVTVPASVGTLMLAGSFTSLLHYPASFGQVAPVITLLSINIPFIALDMVLGTVLIALGRQKAWTGVGIVAAVLNPLANLWVIPFTQHTYGNGAIGAALTTIMSEVIMLIGALILRPRNIFTPGDVFYMFRCALAAAVMVPAVWALSLAGIGIVPAVGYGMLLYAMAAYTLQVIRNDDLKGLLAVAGAKMGADGLTVEQLRAMLAGGLAPRFAAAGASVAGARAAMIASLARLGVVVSYPITRMSRAGIAAMRQHWQVGAQRLRAALHRPAVAFATIPRDDAAPEDVPSVRLPHEQREARAVRELVVAAPVHTVTTPKRMQAPPVRKRHVAPAPVRPRRMHEGVRVPERL